MPPFPSQINFYSVPNHEHITVFDFNRVNHGMFHQPCVNHVNSPVKKNSLKTNSITFILWWRKHQIDSLKKTKNMYHSYFSFGAESWNKPSLWWTLTLHGFNILLKVVRSTPFKAEEHKREQTWAHGTLIKVLRNFSIISSRCSRSICWWNDPIQTQYWKQSLQPRYRSQVLRLLPGYCWLRSSLCQMHKEPTEVETPQTLHE